VLEAAVGTQRELVDALRAREKSGWDMNCDTTRAANSIGREITRKERQCKAEDNVFGLVI